MKLVLAGEFDQEDTQNYSFTHSVSDFYIGKYEVTYDLWYEVYSWALINGYTFANSGREGSSGTIEAEPTDQRYNPVTSINWRDCIVWCNAYSEQSGLNVAYRNTNGQVIKDSTNSNSDDDNLEKGYRLQSRNPVDKGPGYGFRIVTSYGD